MKDKLVKVVKTLIIFENNNWIFLEHQNIRNVQLWDKLICNEKIDEEGDIVIKNIIPDMSEKIDYEIDYFHGMIRILGNSNIGKTLNLLYEVDNEN